MQRTLFLIPHEIAGIPVVGLGWLLMLLAVVLAVRLWNAKRSGQNVGQVLSQESVMWGAIAIAIVFVLPIIELKNLDGEPVGMAIRGYGVMLITGVSAASSCAAPMDAFACPRYRAAQMTKSTAN